MLSLVNQKRVSVSMHQVGEAALPAAVHRGKQKPPDTSRPTGAHLACTHLPKDPNCEIWKDDHRYAQDARTRHEKRADGLPPPTACGDLITAGLTTYRMLKNESRAQHRNAHVAQGCFLMLASEVVW